MTRSYLTLFILFLLVLIFSCDDSDAPGASISCEPDYKNQNLQGMINGEPWEFAAGIASIDSKGNSYDHKFLANDTVAAFPCGVVLFRAYLGFGISGSSSGFYELGEKKLHGQSPGGEAVSFGFFYYDGPSPSNIRLIQANCGTYEIFSIDTANNMLTGRMDVYKNDQNFVNGNFTLSLCPN